MTTTAKTVRRETYSSSRYKGKARAIIIELSTTYVSVRLKGTRAKFTATYDQIFRVAAENAARALREERKQKRMEARRHA